MFNDKYLLTKAVIEGNKTQTRRILKSPSPYKSTDIAFPVGWINEDEPEKDPLYGSFCWVNKDNPQEHTDWVRPQFKESEVVAVAQSYKALGYSETAIDISPKDYRVARGTLGESKGWNNKMFVRADACKFHIRITDVRLQRLQDISDEDCLAEGIIKNETRYCFKEKVKQTTGDVLTFSINFDTPREAYAALIDKISGKGTWDSNPWVWAYTFELVK